MAKYRQGLDATFAALADPTRRGILEQLSRGQSRVTELAKPYDMALPTFSKHLKVLEKAGLVRRSRVGREHRIHIAPQPIEGVRNWISMYAEVWQRQFDALEEFLEEAQRPANQTDITKEKIE